MPPRRPHTPGTGHQRLLRLWLAVLLACAPLLSAAQPLSPGDDTGTAQTGHAARSVELPCHGKVAATPPMMADCPHCQGEAPAGQCPHECQLQCQTAPAGAPSLPAVSRVAAAGRNDYRNYLPPGLTRREGDPLYRPPIRSR